VPRILVPQSPGILCALGLLLTDLRTNYAVTRMAPLGESALDAMRDAFAGLERRAEAWFAHEAIGPERRLLARSLDMRYAGQNYELTVPFPAGPIDATTVPRLREAFERVHTQMYGYAAAEEPIQAVTFRLEATGIVKRAELKEHPFAGADPASALTGRRDVYFPETKGFVSCPVYDREQLGPGMRLAGPAIVEQMDSTTVILPGQLGAVDAYLNILIEA